MAKKTLILNKKHFVKIIAEQQGVTNAEAVKVYDNFVSAFETAICTGRRVLIGELMRIEAAYTPAGKARNPKTKETIDRPEKGKLKVFTSSKWQDKLLEVAKNKA